MNKEINQFHIVFCDDDQNERDCINELITGIQKKYPNIIDFRSVDFPKMEEIIKNKGEHIDLLILDYWGSDDEKSESKSKNGKPAGITILNLNGTLRAQKPIPIVFYSGHIEEEVASSDFKELIKIHPFVIDRIAKTMIAKRGQKELEKFIINKLLETSSIPPNFLIDHETYSIKQNIAFIKNNRLIEIIDQLKLNNDEPIRITEFGKGGLSGAIILELGGTADNSSSTILKLAVNPDTSATQMLKQEHDRAKQYNDQFPRSLTNNINGEWYTSSDGNVSGFIMAKIDNSLTLYDLVVDNISDFCTLENILKKLFLEERALKSHYESKRNSKEIYNWEKLLVNFDDRILQIRDSYNELYPIIESIGEFDDIFKELTQFLAKRSSLNSSSHNMIKWPELPLTLCHGDFHARNILIQGTENLVPVIIDTGSLGFDHWATDLTRLIVYLFVRGIDAQTKYYYDIHEIKSLSSIAVTIIQENQIHVDSLSWDTERKSKNDLVIQTVNWLVAHKREIYKCFYETYNCEFEFQLQLMKWFLREFYRQASPPNKRVMALLAAFHCFEEAKNQLSTKELIQ